MAAPADAAGCLKGAIVGGVAGHLAHHTIVGALGGCIIGHEMAKGGTSITYADIGAMLGVGSNDADWSKIATASKVEIIKVSSLKGYVAHDTRMQSAINASAAVKALDAKIAADAKLTAKLKGFAPGDVIAAPMNDAGAAVLFVNK